MFDNTRVSRRSFICQLSIAGAATLALPLLASGDPAPADPPMTPIGKTTDFTKTDYKKVTLPSGESIYVTKTANGYRALSAKCTHRGCEILWVSGETPFFKCPCHGGIFDSTGKNTSGPPPKPLTSLTTKVQDGQVYIVNDVPVPAH